MTWRDGSGTLGVECERAGLRRRGFSPNGRGRGWVQVRHLELLKLRFGEDALRTCEVMLKDMAESRRIAAFVADGQPAPPSVCLRW